MRILVVEDEQRLAGLIQQGLEDEGHPVDAVHSSEDALDYIAVGDYDAIVLDVMLPGMSGFDLCRNLRANRNQTPILLLTARDAVEDRVAGLDAGADDYLVKPFAFAELSARLRALSRRPAETLDPILTVGPLKLDPATRQVWRGDDGFDLPNKQFRILEILMRHPNQVLTRTMITDHVWDYDVPNSPNVVDVHIRALRRLLDDPYEDKLIQTVRGAGYRISADGS